MGEFLRSRSMKLIHLVIPFDVAHDTVDELGRLGVVQFRDMNPHLSAPQRAFVNDVKRIDEMERRLRFFNTQVKKFCEKTGKSEDLLANMSLSMRSSMDADYVLEQASGMTSLPELEAEFDDLEKSIIELNQGEEGLRRDVTDTFERRSVLEIVHNIFKEAEQGAGEMEVGGVGVGEGVLNSSLSVICGSIPRDKTGIFQRVIWRVTRGNMFLKIEDIADPVVDPVTEESIEKSAFLILSQSNNASDKIRKLCESFGASVFECPSTSNTRMSEIMSLRGREHDLKLILTQNARGAEQLFSRLASNYEAWRVRITKEKGIFHTLNLFRYDLGGKTLIAEGWVPEEDIERVSVATRVATQKSGSMLPVVMKPVENSKETPPTYFKTNKYTWAHQEIVDAYGIAKYQEINPAVFSIVTFPFLFGVMFGDVGHGIMMLIFVSYLIYKEDDFMKGGLNEMVQTCFDGRYIIVLMAIFAIYNGFLYNEFFSVPMAWGGLEACSMYEFNPPSLMMSLNNNSYVYPFGVDPAWKGATNELYYYNSLKMKMSVLLGVSQMMLGIFLSGMNALHKKKWLDVWCEFVPQVLFMMCIFGYLCILIVAKWFLNWETVLQNDPESVGREVPSLLTLLVNMFLSPMSLNEGDGRKDKIYSSQTGVQIGLLLLALVCVPWMLFPKPFLLKREHEAKKNQNRSSYLILGQDDESGNLSDEEEEEEEEFEFQEVMIHQVIHTIEYVLGAISNTASYLRLWALSLAHSELSTVFWEKLLIGALETKNPAAMVIGFGAWAALNFAVLMVMESLSAFLHALRLHWVEFMNKFYGGDGYKFTPFSYDRILAEVD